MKRLLLILVVALFGFAAQSAYAQDEVCATVVECDEVTECIVTVPCCEEATKGPQPTFMQQYGLWFLILFMFGVPALIALIIVKTVKRRRRNDELALLIDENRRLIRENEIARLKEENERLRNNLK